MKSMRGVLHPPSAALGGTRGEGKTMRVWWAREHEELGGVGVETHGVQQEGHRRGWGAGEYEHSVSANVAYLACSLYGQRRRREDPTQGFVMSGRCNCAGPTGPVLAEAVQRRALAVELR